LANPELSLEQRTKIEDILKALDQCPSKEIENRRQASRVSIRTHLTCHLLMVPGYPQIQIHTRNISTNGMGFVSRRPFKTGELLVVEFMLVPKMGKLLLTAATFSRYVREGLYEVGCTFRESVPKQEMESTYTRDRFPARWLALVPMHAVR
jgi:hypothetical protein